MEDDIQNTIIIDGDKNKKSKDNEEIDIFEQIFDEIKDNFKSVDGDKEDNKNIEIKTENIKKSEEVDLKDDKKQKEKKNLGSFEIWDDEDYKKIEEEEKAKKENNSLKDEFEVIS